jgi:hypothetical protein
MLAHNIIKEAKVQLIHPAQHMRIQFKLARTHAHAHTYTSSRARRRMLTSASFTQSTIVVRCRCTACAHMQVCVDGCVRNYVHACMRVCWYECMCKSTDTGGGLTHGQLEYGLLSRVCHQLTHLRK